MNYNNGTTESVDVLMPTDMDGIDDIAEEAHHRRASYTNDIKDESRMNGSRERGDRDERGREDERRNDDRSRDRRHSSREGRDGHHSHRSGSPSRGGGGGGAGAGGAMERDDKYDRPRPSGNDRERRRSRSRSPARHGTVRDRRVYVGNLSYDVKWTNLKDFMREIGPVAHADVLLGRDGRSKGCGVVEYQNPEDAQAAIRKLNDVVLMGRPVFVREDRESDTRIGFSGGRGGGSERRESSSSGSRQIFIGNLPYSVNWKDLKDMFRRVGPVDRADVFMGRDNRSKGSGTVSFDSSQDVPRAISMFNGYDWHGRRIEVREDKFGPPSGGGGGSSRAPPSPPRYEPSSSRGGSYRDDYSRSGDRANYGGDSYGYSGSSRGHDEYRPSDRHTSDRHHGSSHDSYGSRHLGDSSMNSVPSGPAAGSGDQIYVRNLPLTTTDQDLKDLFRSCGPIMMTEVLEHAGRPKGSGVVRFESFESADKAVSKFNGWIYGGRSLEVIYDRV